MKGILALDPGVSSGWAWVHYDADSVTFGAAGQVEGGAAALSDWVTSWSYPDDTTVIAEKYVPLPGKGFHHTLGSVEPLRGEGVLIAHGLMPDYPDKRWRRPDKMYLQGGKSLAEKKRNSHQFLKETGFYVTGKDVGCKDANDARSALLHALSYLAQVEGHRPTFELITDWTEANG